MDALNVTGAGGSPRANDVRELLGVLDQYFSEYGSWHSAQPCLRVIRALGWPEDDLYFVKRKAGEDVPDKPY